MIIELNALKLSNYINHVGLDEEVIVDDDTLTIIIHRDDYLICRTPILETIGVFEHDMMSMPYIEGRPIEVMIKIV